MLSSARVARGTLIALASCGLFALSHTVAAQDTPPVAAQMAPIGPGDMAVSGFSGTALSTESLEPGADPVDSTVINLDGASIRVFDLATLNSAPAGQVANAPVKFEVLAKDIGQVFALTFDDGTADGPPNLYSAATTAFGIQIVAGEPDKEGKPVRLKAGAANARFMDGQFGGLPGASPGAIYKIDGTTGAAAVIADTGLSGVKNSGPGIGDLAFNPQSRSLYASDLDTGYIHHFTMEPNVAAAGQFDHGVTGRPARGLGRVIDDGKLMDITSPSFKPDDPSTWGFTQKDRQVNGLAVHGGRLYYAVAEGPEIWSVGLNADGSFGADPRSELAVKADQPLPVTDIVFDGQGHMVLAQRGAPKSAYDYSQLAHAGVGEVLRYSPSTTPGATSAWSPEPQEFAVGFAEGHRAAAGGVSLQYAAQPDGTIDLQVCDGRLAFTGDALRHNPQLADELKPGGPAAIHGVQINALDLVRPANVPPRQSVFVDFDYHLDDDLDAKGHVGDVEIFRRCEGLGAPGAGVAGAPVGTGLPVDEEGPPVVAEGGLPPVEDGPQVADAEAPPIDPNAPPVDPNAPPVEDGPPIAGEEAPAIDPNAPPVDPNAPPAGPANLAVEKTQNCRLVQLDKGGTVAECEYKIAVKNTGKGPFEFGGGGVDDVITGQLKELQLSDFSRTVNGASSIKTNNSKIIAPGDSVLFSPIKAKFVVPASGVSVENCASLTLPPAGTHLLAQFPKNDVVADLPPLPASTVNGVDVGVTMSAVPQCRLLVGERECRWNVTITNHGTAAADVGLTFSTDQKVLVSNVQGFSLMGANADLTVTQMGGLAVPAKAVKSFTVQARMLIGSEPVNATIRLDKADSNLANNEASAIAGTIAPEVLPTIVSSGADEDAADNTSCIVWNSNKPNDQGTPTNTPTIPQPAPPQQPPPTAKLKIEKKAAVTTCSAVGGGCVFDITLTNAGTADFPGRIEIEDAVTADGAVVPTTQLTDIPGQGWNCFHENQGKFFCSRNSGLAAGASSVLRLTTRLGASDAKQIKNCATLIGDNSPPACAVIPLTKIDKPVLRATKVLSSGDCKPNCKFSLKVTNVGDASYKGPLRIIDKLTPDSVKPAVGGADAVMITSDPNGFDCSLAAPGFFVCNRADIDLQPGSSTEIVLSVSMVGTSFKGDNCLELAVPLADNDLADRCVRLDLDIPPPQFALKVEKQAPNAVAPGGRGHCGLNGLCRFPITITNTGTQPLKIGPANPLSVTDLVTPSIGSSTPEALEQGVGSPAGWECSRVAPAALVCKHVGGEINFAPAASLRLEVSVTPGATWKNSQSTILMNCAIAQIGKLESNRACAHVKLDPFALKIEKSGAQSCEPGGECRFDLDIFNEGPIPHDDPVTVVDNLTGIGAAQIVSITPAAGAKPFPCMPEPAQVPFTCSGHMKLAVGDHNKYTITLRLPEAGPGSTSFRNCASVSSKQTMGSRSPGEAPSPGNPPGAEASDCHEVKVGPPPPAARDEPRLIVEKRATVGTCTDDGGGCTFEIVVRNAGGAAYPGPIELEEVVKADGAVAGSANIQSPIDPPWSCSNTRPGRFACTNKNALSPGSETRLSVTYRLRADTGARQIENCANAKGGRPACASIPLSDEAKPPQCRGGMVLSGAGRCICPTGQIWTGRACAETRAEPRPEAPASSGGADTVQPSPIITTCPEGTVLVGGVCRTTPVSVPRVCTESRPVGEYPNCCPRGTQYSHGVCRPVPRKEHRVCSGQRPVGEYPNCCPRGTEYSRGACRPVQRQKPKICSGARPVGEYPNCCPLGTSYKNGVCMRAPPTPPSPIACPPNRPVGSPPNCCPQDTRYKNGVCVRTAQPRPQGPTVCPPGRPVGTPPNCCPQGTQYERGKCRPPKCPQGMMGTPPNCCPPGTRYDNGKCLKPPVQPGPCPDGYRKLDKPNKYGAYCEQIPAPQQPPPPAEPSKCRGNMIGKPPFCRCPPGKRLVGGRFCLSKKPKCPPGQFPNSKGNCETPVR